MNLVDSSHSDFSDQEEDDAGEGDQRVDETQEYQKLGGEEEHDEEGDVQEGEVDLDE